jgi:TrpR-related protein YerC/YecD
MYKSKLRSKDVNELFDAILTLENRDDCYRFFEDVCTANELISIAQRFQVAKMLSEKMTYTEIEKATGASTATISRVNKCMVYGADGYGLVLGRLASARGESEKKDK